MISPEALKKEQDSKRIRGVTSSTSAAKIKVLVYSHFIFFFFFAVTDLL